MVWFKKKLLNVFLLTKVNIIWVLITKYIIDHLDWGSCSRRQHLYPVFSYKLWYIAGFGLVEMAISTNPKPAIYRSLYENTDPIRVIYELSSQGQPLLGDPDVSLYCARRVLCSLLRVHQHCPFTRKISISGRYASDPINEKCLSVHVAKTQIIRNVRRIVCWCWASGAKRVATLDYT